MARGSSGAYAKRDLINTFDGNKKEEYIIFD